MPQFPPGYRKKDPYSFSNPPFHTPNPKKSTDRCLRLYGRYHKQAGDPRTKTGPGGTKLRLISHKHTIYDLRKYPRERSLLGPPQDAVLLLQDRISPGLRKQLKQHNTTEGLGQFANHTCCDTHWNANLEVAAVDHHEETTSEPMGILRAKKDIEPDTEILARYWHTTKDAWHNIFVCQCCACTNHTGMAPDNK